MINLYTPVSSLVLSRVRGTVHVRTPSLFVICSLLQIHYHCSRYLVLFRSSRQSVSETILFTVNPFPDVVRPPNPSLRKLIDPLLIGSVTVMFQTFLGFHPRTDRTNPRVFPRSQRPGPIHSSLFDSFSLPTTPTRGVSRDSR